MPFTYAHDDRSVLIFHPRHKERGAPPTTTRLGQWFGLMAQPMHQRFSVPDLRLHYQLGHNPHNARGCADIVWDVIHPPNRARVPDPTFFKRWKAPDISFEALQPTVDKIWILSDHPALAYWMGRWGPVIVRSDKITIGEVLEGIYTYLRKPLTRDDLWEINRVPGNRESLRYARAQRAKDSHEIESVVLAHGYKRVDVVGGHRKFQGLRVVILPDQTWRLYLGLCPGPVPRIP